MSRKAKKIMKFGTLIAAIFCYSFSIILPIYVVLIREIQLQGMVDPEVINGILTVSAILFGFSTFQIGKRELRQYLVLGSVLAMQLVFISLVGMSYFADYVRYEHGSFRTLMVATMSLLINTFSWAIVRMLRIVWEEE